MSGPRPWHPRRHSMHSTALAFHRRKALVDYEAEDYNALIQKAYHRNPGPRAGGSADLDECREGRHAFASAATGFFVYLYMR